MIKFLKIAAVAAMTIGLCGPALAADNVKIGVTMPLTGNVAFDGQNTVKGMQTAVQTINEAGGIMGRQVELVVLDDKANPEEGVNAVKRLMSEEKVNAIASALNSSVGLAEIDVTKDKILHVIVLASAPAITDKGYENVFRVNTTSASKEEPLIEYMKTRIKKPAFILTNDDYGRGLAKMYEEAWKDGGPSISSTSFFQLTETNFLPYLTKIKFDNPDGLYIAAQAVQMSTILKQAAQIGFKPETIWTVGASINPTTLKLGGELLNGVISSDNYLTSIDSPANKEFLAAFKKAYPDDVPQFYHAVGYDSVRVIAAAMNAAQSTDDWQKIAAAMHGLTYESPRGTITFDDNGQLKLKTFLVQVRDGKPEIME